MASRKEQKEQARAQRLAKEQAAAEQATRLRRMQVLGGVVVVAIVVVVVAFALGSGGSTPIKPETAAAKTAAAHVKSLLAGIPESGDTLGKPDAPVTITEYGDLECSVCDEGTATPTSFSNPEGETGTGWEDQLITQYVRTGKAKLVYKSLETASSENPDQSAFEQQQVAAYAAGVQDKAWYFIELMYNEQGAEGSNYVSESYLQGLAKQIPGLKFSKWLSDRNRSSLKHEVSADIQEGTTVDDATSAGGASTPTIVVSGPIGTTAKPIVGLPTSYSAYVAAIKSVA